MCLKTTMSKYFRNSCLKGKKKSCRGIKKKKQGFSLGEKINSLHPKPMFGLFLEKRGKKTQFSKSWTFQRVWNELSWALAVFWLFYSLKSPPSSVSFHLWDRGNNLYQWLLGERPQQFVYANQVVPANHALFSVVSVVCKCTESEQGIYS